MTKQTDFLKSTATKRSTSRMRLDDMVTTLRDEIIGGIRKIGDFLPSELHLSQQYQLSKNTVHKGLQILVDEGYIEKIPRIGAKIVMAKSASTITLKFGYYASLVEETQILMLIEKFHLQYPNIHVIPVRLPHTSKDSGAVLEDLLQTLDVFTINVTDYSYLSDPEQIFEPMEQNKDIYSFLNKPFLHQDRLNVMPFIFSPVILCYNKDHFKQHQMPEPNSSWTWEEAKKYGRLLTDPPNRYGLFFHLPSENRWPLFLMQNDVASADENVFLSLSEPRFRKSMERCMEIIEDEAFVKYLSENDGDVQSLFLNQKASMVVVTYMSLNAFQNAPFAYDISPVPYFNSPKTLLVIVGIAVSKRSNQKIAAKTFSDFLLSFDTQLAIRQRTLSIPALSLAAEWTGKEELKQRPSRFPMYREIIPTMHSIHDLNLSSRELYALSDELKYYWSHLDDLDTVMERISSKLKLKSNS